MGTKFFCSFSLALLCLGSAVAQKVRQKHDDAAKTLIFAVLNDGKMVEPIAYVENKKLEPVASDGEGDDLKRFGSQYYSPRSVYTLIFGGAAAGAVAIGKSNIGTDCGGNSADVISKPLTAKLSGLVMGLATNARMASRPGFRLRPTPKERAEVETLVRTRFLQENASNATLKNLRYHNLTSLDVDHDGTAEFVGSYWITPKADERRLLFFIAQSDKTGKYALSFSDYSIITPDEVTSGDIKDLDGGIGHELLLDVFDFDGDGLDEIFTIGKAFEGNNYYVYRRDSGTWARVFETYNYRCGY